jgi:hypothetical protein
MEICCPQQDLGESCRADNVDCVNVNVPSLKPPPMCPLTPHLPSPCQAYNLAKTCKFNLAALGR